jgi:hypothetical protein
MGEERLKGRLRLEELRGSWLCKCELRRKRLMLDTSGPEDFFDVNGSKLGIGWKEGKSGQRLPRFKVKHVQKPKPKIPEFRRDLDACISVLAPLKSAIQAT